MHFIRSLLLRMSDLRAISRDGRFVFLFSVLRCGAPRVLGQVGGRLSDAVGKSNRCHGGYELSHPLSDSEDAICHGLQLHHPSGQLGELELYVDGYGRHESAEFLRGGYQPACRVHNNRERHVWHGTGSWAHVTLGGSYDLRRRQRRNLSDEQHDSADFPE